MKFTFYFFCIMSIIACLDISANESRSPSYNELNQIYQVACNTPHNINEHLPALRQLAAECDSSIEIGLENIVSTWAILLGLSESPSSLKSYFGIDIERPPINRLKLARRLAEQNGIAFRFLKENDMLVEIKPTDLLFIDSLHTYCHLTFELEKFSPQIRKYIAMHDTSAPWGELEDDNYFGDYSEYPEHFDRTKKGLWVAVEDFLNRHPEWTLHQRYFNNYGFTILRRVAE